MNKKGSSIQDAFGLLTGKQAWGLTRTHGSMFFLEIGKPLRRRAEKKEHGEWHFLFELCHWRIATYDVLLVGSDDTPSRIDEVFSALELGVVKQITAPFPTHDLQLIFSSGYQLSTLSASSVAKNEWTQWQLYEPDDSVWVVNASGDLSQTNAYT